MTPLLVAECCQNHNGSRETLKRMIHAAAEAGADYVKTQALHSWELTYRPRFEEGVVDEEGTVRAIKRPYGPERERLSGLDLTPDDEAWFVDECLRAGVRSMITAFTRAAVDGLGQMGYDAVKIASYDCRSYPLLRDVRRHWSTIVVSTGATYDHEVGRAAAELAGTQFTFLHCVTLYPTPVHELHLRRMQWLRRFTPSVGYSDHTAPGRDGLWPAKVALALGADMLERHFTVLDPSETKDGPVSVNPAMLGELRDFANRPRTERIAIVSKESPEWEVMLGQAQRELSHDELLNRDFYAGRVASKVDGHDVFNWEDADLASSRSP
jgi:sialic acid synthase SpsE